MLKTSLVNRDQRVIPPISDSGAAVRAAPELVCGYALAATADRHPDLPRRVRGYRYAYAPQFTDDRRLRRMIY